MNHLKLVPELPKPTIEMSLEETSGSKLNDTFYKLLAGEIAGITIDETEITRVTSAEHSKRRVGQMAVICTDISGQSHLFEYVCGTDEPVEHTIIEPEVE